MRLCVRASVVASVNLPKLALPREAFEQREAAERLASFGDEVKPVGGSARFAAILDLELPKNGRNMMGNGLLGEEQTLGDSGVAEPFRDEREDLDLARCETSGILARAGT